MREGVEEKGGQNDLWHIVQRHEDEEGGEIYFEIINYARHECIYIHGATEARANALAKILNNTKY